MNCSNCQLDIQSTFLLASLSVSPSLRSKIILVLVLKNHSAVYFMLHVWCASSFPAEIAEFNFFFHSRKTLFITLFTHSHPSERDFLQLQFFAFLFIDFFYICSSAIMWKVEDDKWCMFADSLHIFFHMTWKWSEVRIKNYSSYLEGTFEGSCGDTLKNDEISYRWGFNKFL
jgi:hypothetical protein